MINCRTKITNAYVFIDNYRWIYLIASITQFDGQNAIIEGIVRILIRTRWFSLSRFELNLETDDIFFRDDLFNNIFYCYFETNMMRIWHQFDLSYDFTSLNRRRDNIFFFFFPSFEFVGINPPQRASVYVCAYVYQGSKQISA